MPTITDILDNLLATMSIGGVPSTADAGQPITAGLAPPLGPVNVTEIVQQPIALDLIAKDVVFTEKDFTQPGWVEDPDITKILPLFNLALAIPTLDPSGVPGLIGKLKGTFPIAVPGQVVPSLKITWHVYDENDVELAEGDAFLAPTGMGAPTLNLSFLPIFERFDGVVPSAKVRKIGADVTLTVGAVSRTATIGPVSLLLPVIPFPKVLALTVDSDFHGAALIVVPDASGINTINHLKSLLQPVRNAIQTLTSISRFVSLLTGIDTLTGILEATNIEFRKDDRINNLNDITLIQRAWYENDTEAEDELSSFVYLSPPPPLRSTDNQLEMCNARDMSSGEGKITVSTGLAFVAMCRTLHSATPALTPSGGVDGATLTVNNAPSGWRWFGSIETFGDELSSLRFL